MARLISCLLLFALVFVTPFSIIAQTPTPAQAEDKVVSGTIEVIFDAVVKDKKGRRVKDLQAEDFQITEDGVPQEVKSFRLVNGDAPNSPANSPGKSAGDPKATARVLEAFMAGRIGTVALVFDRLSPDARNRAHNAAIAYLGTGLGQSDFVGVFGIDQTLTVFQTFTNEEKLVRPAIDKAGSTTSTTPSTNRSQIVEMRQSDLSLRGQLAVASQHRAGKERRAALIRKQASLKTILLP